MLIDVLMAPGSRRARLISEAMSAGINKFGDTSLIRKEEFYAGPHADGVVFYGLYGKIKTAFMDYKRAGKKAVYVDLGYWNRTEGGKLYGYHKVAINSRHPTAYYQRRSFPADRFARLGVKVEPWNKTGTHILIAGMGAKAADCEGFKPNEWEEAACRELRLYTDRPIMYRPKPSWRHATPIEGTLYSTWPHTLEEALTDCWAVVSHHSNVCVDAILAGVPAFCYHGVAAEMGQRDLSLIESPIYPDGRYEWACNIAYTQWRPDEMRSGACWKFLREEGIV